MAVSLSTDGFEQSVGEVNFAVSIWGIAAVMGIIPLCHLCKLLALVTHRNRSWCSAFWGTAVARTLPCTAVYVRSDAFPSKKETAYSS